MGKAILVLVLLLTLTLSIILVSAETTFFDQDDAFIMGNSPVTPTADSGVTGGTTGGGGCRYEWNCTNWNECLSSGKQTRNCTNIGTCSDTYKTPEINQNCTYAAPEVGKESKELEKENVTKEEEEKEIGEQGRIGGIIKEENVDKNKIIVYSIIILIILFIIFYLKKDYLKKLIKK
ncbi:MAG: hypothetical protein AABX65_03940 [Nanoarchaeota archaeon]